MLNTYNEVRVAPGVHNKNQLDERRQQQCIELLKMPRRRVRMDPSEESKRGNAYELVTQQGRTCMSQNSCCI